VLAAALPATAAAQEPPPAPAPPAATITAALAGLHHDGRRAVALRGGSFRVAGVLAPATPGEVVALRISRKGKVVRTRRVPVAADGSYAVRIRATRPGRLRIRALHPASPALGAAAAPRLTVSIVAPRATFGARGPLIRLLQRGLARLRYAVPRSGTFDAGTARAVMAFRKVNGMARRYDADRRVVEKVLAGRGAFKPKHPDAGRHVEADISRQVLALIDGGRVVDTYHTSTGAPATPTIIGSFRVYRKDPGTNALGMVKSSYFIRGYAIHGYVDVPAFNASHGCLRVPIPDAQRIYDWVRMGDRVITYP
jgi:lipoprotein-anchoring transpeptidase ErfK/SrfK